MTKTAMLAQALRGKVVEDQGYRGVVYVDDRNEFVRFHSMYGVHQVSRRAKTWRVVRSILTAEEVEPYLREAGVLPDINAAVNVMDSMATQLNGEVIARFSSGGGVVKCEFGFIRFSNITGLDKVELVITKWRSVRKLMGRTEALHNIITHKLGDAVRALFDTSLGETA